MFGVRLPPFLICTRDQGSRPPTFLRIFTSIFTGSGVCVRVSGPGSLQRNFVSVPPCSFDPSRRSGLRPDTITRVPRTSANNLLQ